MKAFSTLPALIPLALLTLSGLAACDHAPPPQTQRQSQPTPPFVQVQRDTRPTSADLGGGSPGGSQRQRQADFLNRIRQADPQFKTIDRAVLNGQNELGLILDRSVNMDDIPKLMRGLLGQMAKEFPGQDLNIVAYTPSNPPMKIGTAHLDARSRDMSYTAEHP